MLISVNDEIKRRLSDPHNAVVFSHISIKADSSPQDHQALITQPANHPGFSEVHLIDDKVFSLVTASHYESF